MAFVEVAANSDSGAYQIDNSGLFGGAGTFLTKSQSDDESDTDRRIFTVSGWYKQTLQGSAGGWNGLWSAMADSNNFTSLKINGDKELIFDLKISGTNKSFTTTRRFRDPAAWYHIVVAYDSTDGTAADRLKIYVNGDQAAGTFSADITQNDPAHWGDDASAARVGAYGNNTGDSYMHNGYMADVCCTVGYALAPTAFGKTDDNGVWIPIKPSVTYSANGFFCEFQQTGTSQNSSGLGADTSGKDNHFAIDSDATQLKSTTDTPTNNFCTANPLVSGFPPNYLVTLSEGNLKVSETSSNWKPYDSTMGVQNGKWYWECENVSGSPADGFMFGIQSQDGSDITGIFITDNRYPGYYSGRTGFSYDADGNYRYNGTSTGTGAVTYTNGDTVMLALDMDNGFLYAGKNGSWNNSGAPTSGSSGTGNVYSGFSGKTITPCNAINGGDVIAYLNFGNPVVANDSSNADANGYGDFEYAVPSGYYALCTKNLAEFG